MYFKPKTLDYTLSPYTGMVRESFIEAGKYLLEGVFRNIRRMEDPVIVPRRETLITYPHLQYSKEKQEIERHAEIFEGLTRTFLIGSVLIENEKDVSINGICLREYYKTHFLRICTKGDPLYVGTYEDQLKTVGSTDHFRAFQQTVETCAMVIGLEYCKEQIWDTYTQQEKDLIAEFIGSYAHNSTVPQNWRMFNMLDMAFLQLNGYPIKEEVMKEHVQAILAYYAGDGWYRDGHSFDYYSVWAFQVYGPIWNVWYGYEHMPYAAKKIEQYSNQFMESYPNLFDEDGYMNMWGRSCIYRNASTSAFAENFLLKESTANPGLARRICAGSLLQFMEREDFLYEGIPTLGFYGQFAPLVQGYSCAESVYWLGKAFLCLHLKKDHPFWTSREENGDWENLKNGEVLVKTLKGPGLCISNHKDNRTAILRSAKVVKEKNDLHGIWNYGKLCYATKYPWEATPQCKTHTVESQMYVLKDLTDQSILYPNVTLFCKEENGILYRRQFFGYDVKTESHWLHAFSLADFARPKGILRVDKMRLFRAPMQITLGAFGFPDHETEIIYKQQGLQKAVILKGTDTMGRPKQLAMTILDGYDDIRYTKSTNTNPESEHSIVVYAVRERKQHLGYEKYVCISQVLTAEDHVPFSEEELFPIEQILYADEDRCGGYGPIRIRMKDASEKVIDFEGMEGNLQL